MNDRVVLVTGAARGIGAATVRQLVASGSRVIAVDCCAGQQPDLPYALATREQLAEVVASCDGAAVGHVADVRELPALQAAVDLALSTWGRLDAAVAAAGVVLGGQPLWESDATAADLLWEVNVNGVRNTAVAALPAMLSAADHRGARFVAVSSAAGSVGLHHLADYCATKHAVVGLVKGIAADLVNTGAAACVVSPGSTRTEMLAATARLYGIDDVEVFAAHQLVGRLLSPDEVASAISYCCRPDSVVNGTVLHADGGFAP